MKPIIGMLHNTKEERYHPILFLPNPTPSGMKERYKSKNHHTAGFLTRQEALEQITNQFVPWCEKYVGKPDLCLEKDFPWDGENTPAMVVFFIKNDSGELIPA
jgi:hypothetical protein